MDQSTCRMNCILQTTQTSVSHNKPNCGVSSDITFNKQLTNYFIHKYTDGVGHSNWISGNKKR